MFPDFWYTVRSVRAKRAIQDSPLARHDDSVQRGAIGSVEDIADDLVWVDFGSGVIPCEIDEIEPVSLL